MLPPTFRRAAACLLAVALAIAPAVGWAAESGGMPQFQFGNELTRSQVVWMVLIFLVLYVLLARWALPQLQSVLEERARRIAADLDAAKAAKAEADAAVTELTAATRDARAQAQSEIVEAARSAREAAARQAAVLNERLETELHEAEARIDAARAAAMGALREVASETAVAMIERLTGRPPQSSTLQAALASSLAATSSSTRG
ncbi:MAG TPA: F0F1 ATP synthase subunit B' [Acetobacteraceae bacterium]|nr:F0F1 ATP synthase subunit B' [Acetobacteraceae bacterium]